MKALRTDVPKEVSKISKMQDVNIQSQHPSEQYFMLTESPGQVAKEFNKVVGLTIMDEALIKINGNVRKTKQKCDSVNEEIATREEKIKNLSWVNGASISLKELILTDTNIKKDILKSDNLFNLVEEYKNIQKEFEKLKSLKQAQKDFSILLADFDGITKNQNLLDTLCDCENSIKMIDSKLISTMTLKNAESQISALFSAEETLNKCKDQIVSYKFAIVSIKNMNKNLNVVEEEIKSLQEEWDSFSGDSCPLCGNKIGEYK